VTNVAILLGETSLEKVNVVFTMTIDTGFSGAQIVRFMGTNFLRPAFFFVALFTGDLGVLTEKRVSGLVVVKGFFVELGGVEISAFVIGVTFYTTVIHQAVITGFLFDIRPDLFVTIETLPIGNSLTGFVTFQALSALELLMTLHQRSGGEQMVEDSLVLRQAGRRQEKQAGQ
jgi:hypothetical protein